MYIIAVNLKETRRQYRKALGVMEDYGLEFVHDKRGATAKRYGVEGIPNMFVIDVDGTVAFRYIGYGESSLGRIIEDINSLIIKNYQDPGEQPTG
jgi:hypothetical protein